MRICELIQTQYKRSTIDQPEIDALKKSDWQKPESGFYAQGSPTSDPHLFQKQTREPVKLDRDPTYIYIKAIEPWVDSNPYFPRTYVVDLRRDAQGNIRPQYQTETLFHGTREAQSAQTPTQGQGVSGESLYHMGVRMWGHEDWIKAAPMTVVTTRSSEQTTNAIFVWHKACALVRYMVENYPQLPSVAGVKLKPEPALRAATRLIHMLLKQHPNLETDLHANNFMIRYTPTGPQMVINDPLSLKNSSQTDDNIPENHKHPYNI